MFGRCAGGKPAVCRVAELLETSLGCAVILFDEKRRLRGAAIVPAGFTDSSSCDPGGRSIMLMYGTCFRRTLASKVHS